jgi:uncharacterized delta-60 repeat protein
MPVTTLRTPGLLAATFALLGALALPATATAELDSFLVPDTRAPVVIAEAPFALKGLWTDGTINTKFGTDGRARSQARFRGVADLRADDAATQADGKIVLSGFATRRTPDGRTPRYVALARFDAAGRPDLGFGKDGTVVTARGGRGAEIAPMADGDLLVGGSVGVPDEFRGRRPMLLRLRPDGTPDRRFGDRGLLVVRLRGGPDYAGTFDGTVTDLVPRPGGGAVVAVRGSFGAGRDYVSLLLRYGPRGRIDRGFGHDGRVALDHAFGVGKAALDLPGIGTTVYALGPGRDGGIVALGEYTDLTHRVAMVGLLPGGGLDRAYGSDGVVLGPEGPPLAFNLGFATEPGGGVTVATAADPNRHSFLLVRFTPDGELADFGGPGGGVTPAQRGRAPLSVAVRPGGDIVVLAFELDPPYAPLLTFFRFENGSLAIWPGASQTRPR